MQWVVGTGRCGLHNYTAIRGGYIHSDNYFREQVVKRHHEEEFDKEYVRSVINWRKDLNVPCVTDCAQFMFIDVIAELDKSANFIWIVREKNPCVESLMRRTGEDKRIHPKDWNFTSNVDIKRRLIEWYYDEVNEIIQDKLKGLRYKKIQTNDMQRVDINEMVSASRELNKTCNVYA